MHITIVTLGSRGDFQPYLALAVGLQRAGYRVRLASHALFRPLAQAYGVADFYPVEGNPMALLRTPAGLRWLESGVNPLRQVLGILPLVRPHLVQGMTDIWQACQGTDAVVVSVLGIGGIHAAEKLGVPLLLAFLQPFTPTRMFPVPGAPMWGLGGWYNWWTFVMAQQMFWLPFRGVINRWRREVLGLRPFPFWGPYRALRQRQVPVLYGYSPSVLPRPDDWPDWHHVTGYWYLERPSDWQPPTSLQQFLQSDPPPLYIGFGSMVDSNPDELLHILLTALARTGQRAVLLRGWANLQPETLPETVCLISDVPHDWLFARVSAVIHHGGAGTTAAGLKAGVPNILVPYFADQFFWADRIRRLGVGPAGIPRRRLTVDALTQAIERVLGDETMRQRAARLGEKIRAEDGVAQAVSLIREIVGPPEKDC
ncbi:MAG: glycosyltransferase [Chloroflexi bacterium]|nr:MAG: glycosyltransferase [Chloroflexota bacterium]